METCCTLCPDRYRWTKDGEDFVPPYVTTDHPGGTFELHNKGLQAFQGKYRCYASNELGTAMTEEIELRVPSKSSFRYKNNVFKANAGGCFSRSTYK